MKSKVASFDLDGTVIEKYLLHRAPYSFYPKGLFALTALSAMEKSRYSLERGEIGYEDWTDIWFGHYALGKKGKKLEDILKAGQAYIKKHPEQFFSFAKPLVSLVKKKGYIPIIISGAAPEVVAPVASSLGVEVHFESVYEVEDGVFTGRLISNCAIDEVKRQVFRKYVEENNVDASQSTGFGDTPSDLAFLDQVGFPVAVMPHIKLREIATRQMSEGRIWLICNKENDVVSDVDLYLP